MGIRAIVWRVALSAALVGGCDHAAPPSASVSAAAVGALTSGLTFTDVAVPARIARLHHPNASLMACVVSMPGFGPGGFCEPQLMAGAGAAGDYDGDGWTDLFVTRLGARGCLYRNRGDGTFEDATVAAGLDLPHNTNGAVWVDVDNDADRDLFVTTMGGRRHYLYLNDGAGGFTEDAVARGLAGFNGAAHVGFGAAVGDYDRDGWLDLFVTEWKPRTGHPRADQSNARLLRNRGAQQPGHFEDVTHAAGIKVVSRDGVFVFAPAFVDLDDDGWHDLALTSDFGQSQLYWNQGDGTFIDGTVAAGVGGDENGMGATFGDLDGDGRLEWFVTSIFDPDESCLVGHCNWGATGNRLYRNKGQRRFEDITDEAGVRDGAWGWGTALFDPDNDGDLDLVMTNGFAAPVPWARRYLSDAQRFWVNDSGTFVEAAAALGLEDRASGKGLLVLDMDNDGDLDLFVANTEGYPRLWRNDGGDARPWLRVRVLAASGRDAIGADVRVTARRGGVTQRRVIGLGTHFAGQSEAIAHIGLGDPALDYVHEVVITWPDSGAVRHFEAVPARSTLVVTPEP